MTQHALGLNYSEMPIVQVRYCFLFRVQTPNGCEKACHADALVPCVERRWNGQGTGLQRTRPGLAQGRQALQALTTRS